MNTQLHQLNAGGPRRCLRLRELIAVTIAMAACLAAVPAGAAADPPTNRGTDFVIGFMENYTAFDDVAVLITSDTGTSGTVTVPGIGFSQTFSVSTGSSAIVNIPSEATATGDDSITDHGVHVLTDDPVTVYGLNQSSGTTDGFLALPTGVLGKEYTVLAWPTHAHSELRSEFLIVATEDGTVVTITPSEDTGTGRSAGVPYSVTLGALETYQLQALSYGADLTGSRIVSEKPVAVFAGHRCAFVPPDTNFCDHLVEQIPPHATWGQHFLTVSLATRTGGDIFRILARDDHTDVFIDGALVASLMAGGFHEVDLPSNSMNEIETTRPALVMQYSKGSAADPANGDPFMMMVVPTEQFLDSYIVRTPNSSPVSFDNFINIVVPTDDVSTFMLNGSSISPDLFTPIGATGFSGARLPVSTGAHALAAPNGFGVYVYGFAPFVSYGYPGGLALAPIAALNEPPTCVGDLTLAQDDFIEDPSGTFVVSVGHTITVPFTGDDPDGDDLTATLVGPAGSSLDLAAGKSPLVSTFTWTPTDTDATGTPHLVAVTFEDPSGAQANCSFEVMVNRNPVAVCSAYPSEDPEAAASGSLHVECDAPDGRMITLDGSGSSDPDGPFDDLTFRWDVSNFNVILDDPDSAVTSGIFPIGVTTATLTVTDAFGGFSICDIEILVQDNTPPEVMITTDVAVLWPPNHTMRDVQVIITASDVCEDPEFIFPITVLLRSNEPDNAQGNGDGDTTGDSHGQDGYSAPVNITDEFTWHPDHGEEGAWIASIQLRAERAGSGSGRAYTLDVEALDSNLNVGSSSIVVVVPRGMGGGGGNNN